MDGLDRFLQAQESNKKDIPSTSTSYISYVKSKFAANELDAQVDKNIELWQKDYDQSNQDEPASNTPRKIVEMDEEGIDIIKGLGAVTVEDISAPFGPSPVRVDNFMCDEDEDELVMDYLPSGMSGMEQQEQSKSKEETLSGVNLVEALSRAEMMNKPIDNKEDNEDLLALDDISDEDDDENDGRSKGKSKGLPDDFIETLSMSSKGSDNDSDGDSDSDSDGDGDSDSNSNSDGDSDIDIDSGSNSSGQVDPNLMLGLEILQNSHPKYKGICMEYALGHSNSNSNQKCKDPSKEDLRGMDSIDDNTVKSFDDDDT